MTNVEQWLVGTAALVGVGTLITISFTLERIERILKQIRDQEP